MQGTVQYYQGIRVGSEERIIAGLIVRGVIAGGMIKRKRCNG